MLLNAKKKYTKRQDIQDIMKVYVIPSHSELYRSDAQNFGSALAVSESNMIVLPCVLIKRDKVFSDIAHVAIGTAVHYVFAGNFVASDV